MKSTPRGSLIQLLASRDLMNFFGYMYSLCIVSGNGGNAREGEGVDGVPRCGW